MGGSDRACNAGGRVIAPWLGEVGGTWVLEPLVWRALEGSRSTDWGLEIQVADIRVVAVEVLGHALNLQSENLVSSELI